jgi:hypothetical protein
MPPQILVVMAVVLYKILTLAVAAIVVAGKVLLTALDWLGGHALMYLPARCSACVQPGVEGCCVQGLV